MWKVLSIQYPIDSILVDHPKIHINCVEILTFNIGNQITVFGYSAGVEVANELTIT